MQARHLAKGPTAQVLPALPRHAWGQQHSLRQHVPDFLQQRPVLPCRALPLAVVPPCVKGPLRAAAVLRHFVALHAAFAAVFLDFLVRQAAGKASASPKTILALRAVSRKSKATGCSHHDPSKKQLLLTDPVSHKKTPPREKLSLAFFNRNLPGKNTYLSTGSGKTSRKQIKILLGLFHPAPALFRFCCATY